MTDACEVCGREPVRDGLESVDGREVCLVCADNYREMGRWSDGPAAAATGGEP